jgi:hypothetical protein
MLRKKSENNPTHSSFKERYVGINPASEVKALQNETCKTLHKEIEEDGRWKELP